MIHESGVMTVVLIAERPHLSEGRFAMNFSHMLTLCYMCSTLSFACLGQKHYRKYSSLPVIHHVLEITFCLMMQIGLLPNSSVKVACVLKLNLIKRN